MQLTHLLDFKIKCAQKVLRRSDWSLSRKRKETKRKVYSGLKDLNEKMSRTIEVHINLVL